MINDKVVIIEVNPAIDVSEWRRYVDNHPKGLISHLPNWQKVISETFQHDPFYLFAKSIEGKLCGIFPLFRIKSDLFGTRLVSVPLFHICGPIGDTEEIEGQLVDKAKELASRLKCAYLEMRTDESNACGLLANNYYSSYGMELSDPKMAWDGIDRRTRQSIRKSKELGVTIRNGNTVEDLRRFFEINHQTKQSLGVPGHPLSYLANLRSEFKDLVKIYLAELQGRIIGGLLTVRYKKKVEFLILAYDDKYIKYQPSHLMCWVAVEDCVSNGYTVIDFGRVANDNEGLARFKRHFGCQVKQLFYYYSPTIPRLVSSNRSSKKYMIMTTLWRHAPVWLTRKLDLFAFKQLD